MELCTIDDVANFLREREYVYLYGAGRICELFLEAVSQMGMLEKIPTIFVTDKNENLEKIMEIPIVEFRTGLIAQGGSIIITAASKYQKEIKAVIEKEKEVEEIAALSPKIKPMLLYELQKGQQRERDKLWEKLALAIKFGQKNGGKKDRKDILFFSPPYWDVYSPFSAVPCLVASLKKKGYQAGQMDLGIHCIRHMISKRWKRASEKCTSKSFFEGMVEPYVKNTYQSYEQFKEDMWFFQGEEYNIEEVKERYHELNAVQQGVINAFYSEVYRMGASDINFDRCGDIHALVKKTLTLDYLEVLCSDNIFRVFQHLPGMVAISITSTCQFLPGCALAKLIKEGNPDIKLIFGGSCADLFANSAYQNKSDIKRYFDYVIIGEGETALGQLMDYINGAGKLETIPNLMLFDDDNQAYYTKQIVEDVRKLPPPDYDGLDLDLYLSPHLILPYQTSRGCHYGQCAFCNHDEKYRHNYRSKEMKKVVEELIYLSKRYHTDYFQFVDEAIRPDCFAAMVEEMDRHLEFKNMKWIFYSRVSRSYKEDLLVKARRNGCEMVMFGVETFNQRLLNFIKKGINADTSKYCLALFHKCGIKTYAWLMCNLPSESLEEARGDYEEVCKQIENISAFSIGPFSLVANTDMYQNPSKYNITYIDPDDSLCFSSHHDGEAIDKRKMLGFYREKYRALQNKWCFKGNRYTVFFEET